MKGIFELLKISLEGEKLSEVKKESLYDRILAKIELHELLHAEQLLFHLGEGEVIVQARTKAQLVLVYANRRYG